MSRCSSATKISQPSRPRSPGTLARRRPLSGRRHHEHPAGRAPQGGGIRPGVHTRERPATTRSPRERAVLGALIVRSCAALMLGALSVKRAGRPFLKARARRASFVTYRPDERASNLFAPRARGHRPGRATRAPGRRTAWFGDGSWMSSGRSLDDPIRSLHERQGDRQPDGLCRLHIDR